MRAFPLLLCVLCSLLPCRADEPAAPKERAANTLVECQMVVLPQKIALPLLPRLLDETKIEVAFGEIQTLIANDRAQLSANLISRVYDGRTTQTESVEEIKYGAQYDPPRLPENAPENLAVLKSWPAIAITPVGFETRNAGARIEVSVNASTDEQSLILTAMCEHVRFLRWAKVEVGKLATGELLSIEQPVFHNAKTNCSMLMRDGQRVLVGVHKVPVPADSLELFFLRVSHSASKTP